MIEFSPGLDLFRYVVSTITVFAFVVAITWVYRQVQRSATHQPSRRFTVVVTERLCNSCDAWYPILTNTTVCPTCFEVGRNAQCETRPLLESPAARTCEGTVGTNRPNRNRHQSPRNTHPPRRCRGKESVIQAVTRVSIAGCLLGRFMPSNSF